MKKKYYFIKKFVHISIITILGILMFFGQSFSFFIFSVWSALTSFAIYRNNIFLMSLLHFDFKIEDLTNQDLKRKMLEVRFTLILSIILFVLGLLIYRFPKFF